MKSGDASSPPALGFLTVVEHAQHGLLGGYLVLNPSGRPLEFHCTAPVKPNRAQEILYGPTLQPYLCGDLIAHTLVSKAAVTPLALFTDHRPVLAVRQQLQIPCVLLTEECLETPPPETSSETPGTVEYRLDPPQSALRGMHRFRWGGHAVAVEPAYAADESLLSQHLEHVVSSSDFDWSEPFERIRQAMEEAQRGSR